ncbi:MAG: hypothetical protein FJ245_01910 [Nitrospira sp.]|nr:hypothetical protein [Nitrospira sp.]
MMDPNADTPEPSHGRPPLGAIGVLVALVLLIPTILYYSIAPDEPLKEGVTIFSDGRQRAYLADPSRHEGAGYQDYCVLEPRDQLTIVQPPQRPDGSLLARVERTGPTDVPFCPPQATVFIRPQQVVQKENPWQEIKARLVRLIAP